MRRGLFLATLIGLVGASHISSAADASWVAFPENKVLSAYCGLSRAPWSVDIKGNTLTFSTQAGLKHSLTVDLKALQPDGSGKVVGKNHKGREFYLTFEPGSGARTFYLDESDGVCRIAFVPKA
jgi:hypothetical protein